MARNFDAAELAHYAGTHFRGLHFVEMHFVSGTLRVCAGPRPYNWGGHDWLALGDFGGISALEGSTDLGIRGFTLTLSGIDPGLTASALDRTDYKGREVVVYVGVLDGDGDLVATPKVRRRGFMDVAMVTADKHVGVIQMICEAESMRLMLDNTVRFSDEEHQRRYPGDKIKTLMPLLKDKDVMWGGVRVILGTTQPGSDNWGPGIIRHEEN